MTALRPETEYKEALTAVSPTKSVRQRPGALDLGVETAWLPK